MVLSNITLVKYIFLSRFNKPFSGESYSVYRIHYHGHSCWCFPDQLSEEYRGLQRRVQRNILLIKIQHNTYERKSYRYEKTLTCKKIKNSLVELHKIFTNCFDKVDISDSIKQIDMNVLRH